jgi:penicillin-binding protein 1A
VGLGLVVGATRSIAEIASFGAYLPALPTVVLDRNGNVITELFSEEKRELVSLSEIPQHLIDALLTREDRGFFRHRGWAPLRLAKAIAEHLILGRPLRGASTITQQLAGWRYEDRRRDDTLRRKIRELWWAFQMERRLTKQEILEQYLNEIPLGHNAYGVEAASQFYFGKTVRKVTLAESALMVVIYASANLYSPLRNPENARERSRWLLDEMVRLGYANAQAADLSFSELWASYDWSRPATTSLYFDREDRAPYFSEYVREQLNELLPSTWDVYRDGLRVYTTLDLEQQAAADRIVGRHLRTVGAKVGERMTEAAALALEVHLPVVALLALGFGLEEIATGEDLARTSAVRAYLRDMNPAVDHLAALFTLPLLKAAAQSAHEIRREEVRQTVVQGALVALESTTGRIRAMVGGRGFESTDQFNRATQSRVQPGSAFKPLYYSLAIDSRKATMGTQLRDAPLQFLNPDGTPYQPLNYQGRWEGPVPLWWALADSKNVPSVEVFDLVGQEPAVAWASRMLGLEDPADREAAFGATRGYAIALGVAAVSPLEMARAYATFPNGGELVEPVSIVRIEDRSGAVIREPERDARLGRSGRNNQLMSPQGAAIMTEILGRTVERGTLRGARDRAQAAGADMGPGWDRPIAGKTGTTQNWGAAWAVGFTAQYTTAVWLGFDRGGRSLGADVTGATAAAPAWAEYMDTVHRGLPVQAFRVPETGLIRQRVCTISGLLPTEWCPETEELLFIEGTTPRVYCEIHPYQERQAESVIQRMSPFTDLRSALPDDLFDSFLEDGGAPAGPSPLAD